MGGLNIKNIYIQVSIIMIKDGYGNNEKTVALFDAFFYDVTNRFHFLSEGLES